MVFKDVKRGQIFTVKPKFNENSNPLLIKTSYSSYMVITGRKRGDEVEIEPLDGPYFVKAYNVTDTLASIS